jgi:tripartite-type tricarboxylate transporter receptor subunit TctC
MTTRAKKIMMSLQQQNCIRHQASFAMPNSRAREAAYFLPKQNPTGGVFMEKFASKPSRRTFIKKSGAALGAAALSALPFRHALAAYPERRIQVVIPTGQGGGADLLARTFSDVWGKALGTSFEFAFYPGAGGQVGYETYIGKKDHDGYNLLFGNMGPEMIMYALQNPKYNYPADFQYFVRLDIDDSAVFVRNDSPIKRIEDFVAEGRKRTVNVATSRLPHPASIGVLALGEATKSKFNLVPYGGGNPTLNAVLNGEVDAGVIPVSLPLKVGDKFRILGIFNDENRFAEETGNAPAINKVFGTKIPDLSSSRAWALHTSAIEKQPEVYKKLAETAKQVFSNPAYKEVYEKTGAPWKSISYGDREVCHKYALGMVDLAGRYKTLLTAKKR